MYFLRVGTINGFTNLSKLIKRSFGIITTKLKYLKKDLLGRNTPS